MSARADRTLRRATTRATGALLLAELVGVREPVPYPVQPLGEPSTAPCGCRVDDHGVTLCEPHYAALSNEIRAAEESGPDPAVTAVSTVQLADDADGMTAGSLREGLRQIAGQVRNQESVRQAWGVTHG